MTAYHETVKKLEESRYLISMVSVDELLRFGHAVGLNEQSHVLDLCCGYGTVLKIWHEAFGIRGVGVDLSHEFLSTGRQRLANAGIEAITLQEADVRHYADEQQYDVVICSETVDSIEYTLALGEKFLKSQGVLAYQKVYSRVPNPPQALLDFEGEVLPLDELHQEFRKLGYMLTYMASDSASEWERYITWDARRNIAKLRQNPKDIELEQWVETWYRMYFNYRRPYQGQALFGLEKV